MEDAMYSPLLVEQVGAGQQGDRLQEAEKFRFAKDIVIKPDSDNKRSWSTIILLMIVILSIFTTACTATIADLTQPVVEVRATRSIGFSVIRTVEIEAELQRALEADAARYTGLAVKHNIVRANEVNAPQYIAAFDTAKK